MSGYEQEDAVNSYQQSVDAHPEDYRWSEWLVYPDYDIGEHEGHRYIFAPMAEPVRQLRGRRRYRPLSRPTAALFLEFARWPETEGMDLKPLGCDKNEAAAMEWAEINGVLGLDSSQRFTVFDEASDATQYSLGVYAIGSRTRNEGNGGLGETVEAFAREAWLANMTLRLYEAATNPEGPDVNTITDYMPDWEANLPSMRGVSTRTLHGESPEHTRGWALRVVEEVVENRTRGRVWPIPVRDLGGRLYGYAGHKQGWAFDSLLGAMWLQMLWLMLGQGRRCEWCRKLLDVDPGEHLRTTGTGNAGSRKPPRHKRFCRHTTCRQNWNYHYGHGKSSKEARKKKREGGATDRN